MPTKRTRTSRLAADFMTETHIAWLHGEPLDATVHDALAYAALDDDGEWPPIEPPSPRPWLASGITGRRLWALYGAEIVAEHVTEYPGTRPLRWWQFDAPEPRRRVGGTGTPCHERLAHVLRLHFGVPDAWISPSLARTYELIGKPLGVPALSFDDPPLFESEAAYLDRLGLLSAAERRRLTKADFAPESVLELIAID